MDLLVKRPGVRWGEWDGEASHGRWFSISGAQGSKGRKQKVDRQLEKRLVKAPRSRPHKDLRDYIVEAENSLLKVVL